MQFDYIGAMYLTLRVSEIRVPRKYFSLRRITGMENREYYTNRNSALYTSSTWE
jgi:hypothetical protein